MKMKNFVILPLTIFCLFSICQAQLTVKYSSVKLPKGDSCHRVHYDGDDSIYLLGGCYDDSVRNQILKYSLGKDSITKVGTLATNFGFGSLQADSDGNLWLFGAGPSFNQIVKYDVIRNESMVVVTLPWFIYSQATVSCGGDIVYILGIANNWQKIVSFSMKSFEILEFPIPLPAPARPSVLASTVCVNGSAYTLTVVGVGGANLLKLDFDSKEFSLIGNFRSLIIPPFAVTNGKMIYVIPGYNSTINNQEGILELNPLNAAHRLIPVQNWPLKNDQGGFLYPPQSVFVPRLNRIYSFGGQSYYLNETGVREEDFIFYIDMKDLKDDPDNGNVGLKLGAFQLYFYLVLLFVMQFLKVQET